MKAINLKNILSLLKKTTQYLRIMCKSSSILIVYLCIEDLEYYFEITTDNALLFNYCYLIDMVDLIKVFKHIKSNSILYFFEETSIRRVGINITLNNITQSVKIPFIYDRDVVIIPREIYIPNPKTKLLLSDFCRMIKSLKNTSDFYLIEFDRTVARISNIESVIPVVYNLQLMDNDEYLTKKITNNTLLRLNKLPCDNKYIELGVDFLYSEIENEIRYKISFR